MPTQHGRATAERRWSVDVLRVYAICVVVIVHWISVRVTVTGGHIRGDGALHGTPLWALSWLIQVMPLFFLAGGFANTLIVDRWRAQGRGYGEYLAPRARRLITPVIAFVAVLAPVIGVLRADMAATAARVVASPLWFLAVYLIAVAVAPLAVRLHDHSVWLVPGALLICSLAVDTARFQGGAVFASWNVLFVWLFCHQLGIVHARGALRAVPDSGLLLVAGAGIGMLVVMVLPGPYFPTMFGLADAPVSNLSPPTTAVSVLAVVQFALFTLMDRWIGDRAPTGWVRGVLGYVVARLMTIYLWHVPVNAALTGMALLLPRVLLPGGPRTWWATRPLWILGCAAALVGVVRLATRWDVFCARYLARTTPVTALAAALLAAASIHTIWRHGLFPWGATGLAISGLIAAAVLLTTSTPVAPLQSVHRPSRTASRTARRGGQRAGKRMMRSSR